MSKTVHCAYLCREAEALPAPPHPGALGRRIHEQISKEAWRAWLGHQTTLINEYRLTPFEPRSRKFLEQEMEKFLFGGGADKPADYVAPDSDRDPQQDPPRDPPPKTPGSGTPET